VDEGLESTFPLTRAYLGEAPFESYRASNPEPAASRDEEIARFVGFVRGQHARGSIEHRAARDLVGYEAALATLPAAPALAAADPPPPTTTCVIAPHVHVLVFGGDLPGMLDALADGRRATPRPSRGWLALARGPEGVRRTLLERETGWFLERFREPTAPAEAIEDDEDRALFARLWRDGVLVRA
jgi:hypothetical protein